VNRHLDIDAHVQIAASVALDIPDAFVLQTKHRAGLGARRILMGSPVQRRDLDLRAEHSLHKTNRHFAEQIVAVALEDSMRLDVEDDV